MGRRTGWAARTLAAVREDMWVCRCHRLLDAYAAAPGWEEGHRLLVRRPVLLDERGDVVIGEFVVAAERVGLSEVAERYAFYRGILRRYREVGPERALRELTSDEDDAVIDLAERATAAYERYHEGCGPDTLDAAVRGYEEVLARAVAVPTRAVARTNLGLMLLDRAERDGSAGDTERGLALLEDAVVRTPPGSPERKDRTVNLAGGLLQRHRLDGDTGALDRALALLEPLVDASAPTAADDDPGAVVLWLNLGSAHYARYSTVGDQAELEAAIGCYRRAVAVAVAAVADAQPWSSGRLLGNLAVALSERYQRTGNQADLDGSLECIERTIGVTPGGSPERPARLALHAILLLERHDARGALADLDLAVEKFASALHETPENSPERLLREGESGAVLLARYQRTGELADLDESVAVLRRAVRGRGYEAEDEAVLWGQFGTSLRVRARRRHDRDDAGQAVAALRRAVTLATGTPSRAIDLNNLGGALRLQAELLGTQDPLAEAITAYRDALDHLPPGSPRHTAALGNLGTALLARAESARDEAELDEAVRVLSAAVAGTDESAPDLAGRWCNLGHGLRVRHQRTGQARDVEAATAAYRGSCSRARLASPEAGLLAGRAWGLWAHSRGAHAEASEAFGHASEAAERLMRTQSGREAVEVWLAEFLEVPAHAAYALAATGGARAAAVQLERGRARSLSRALERGRAQLGLLAAVRPDFVERYRRAATRVTVLEAAELAGVRPSGTPTAEV
ncbi:hypothetical protein ACIBCS_41955 [Streptomyces phaeochromogenes]|uniref:hypothetical protein n=1 Tax=Streptomyces phaeochromogenes TaxID=1923 RepID=UPI0033F39F71